jgi:hypothetical protein
MEHVSTPYLPFLLIIQLIRRLTSTVIMLPYLPPHLFGGEDFGNEYLNSLKFAVDFDFGLELSGAYNADYFAGDVEYDGMSVDCLCDNVDAPSTSSSQKKRRPNRQYDILFPASPTIKLP